MIKALSFAVPAAFSVMLLASGAQAAACAGSGVITRIQGGTPTDVVITRAGAQVTKPRVLEVVCAGDVVSAKGAAVVTLSIDGVGAVVVNKTKPYTVGARRGRPGAAGNMTVVSAFMAPCSNRSCSRLGSFHSPPGSRCSAS